MKLLTEESAYSCLRTDVERKLLLQRLRTIREKEEQTIEKAVKGRKMKVAKLLPLKVYQII